MLRNKNILITGGAGFLGRNIIKRYYSDNQITCYSRDESKHYLLKKEFPKVNFIIGDIYDLDSLNEAAKNNQIGIFAASMKQIEACEENPHQAVKTICMGAINSKRVCLENQFEAGAFISSDKACAATTIYGSCKYVAEQSFLSSSGIKLNSCRYGNVTNSTGSIIPVIKQSLENKKEVELFSEEMTRFLISPNQAIDLIEESLTGDLNGVFIPKLKSIRIKDLLEIYKEEFNLKYRVSKPRANEKIHELMFSPEEAPRITERESFFVISKESTESEIREEYSSKNNIMAKEELYLELKTNGFFL